MGEIWPVCPGCGKRHPTHNDLKQALLTNSFKEDRKVKIEVNPQKINRFLDIIEYMRSQVDETLISRLKNFLTHLNAALLTKVVYGGLNLHSEESVILEFSVADTTLLIYIVEEYVAQTKCYSDMDILDGINWQ